MKRKIIAFILITFSSCTVLNSFGKGYLNYETGVGISKIFGNESLEHYDHFRFCWKTGPILEISSKNDKHLYTLGYQYKVAGGKYKLEGVLDYDGTVSQVNGITTIQFYTFPFGYKYQFGNKLKFFLGGGFALNFIKDVSNDQHINGRTYRNNWTKEFNKVIWFLDLASGIRFDVNKKLALNFGLQHSRVLGSLLRDDSDAVLQKEFYSSCGVGYKF